jgi:hypothetical protein
MTEIQAEIVLNSYDLTEAIKVSFDYGSLARAINLSDLANRISISEIAEHWDIDVASVAAEFSEYDIAERMDKQDVAYYIDKDAIAERVAETIDYGFVAGRVEWTQLPIDYTKLAQALDGFPAIRAAAEATALPIDKINKDIADLRSTVDALNRTVNILLDSLTAVHEATRPEVEPRWTITEVPFEEASPSPWHHRPSSF